MVIRRQKTEHVKILALDLGTKMGWAIQPGEHKTSRMSGVWYHQTPKQRRFESGAMRFFRFIKKLEEICDTYHPDLIVYEEVRRHMSVDAAHVYGGFMAQLTVFCEEHNIPCKGVSNGAIKKHATGKGNAGKDTMKKAFLDQTGREAETDDEADAWWLLDLEIEGMGR